MWDSAIWLDYLWEKKGNLAKITWKYKKQHPLDEPEPSTSTARGKWGHGLKRKPTSKVTDRTTGYLGNAFPGSVPSWTRWTSFPGTNLFLLKFSLSMNWYFLSSDSFHPWIQWEGFLLEGTVPKHLSIIIPCRLLAFPKTGPQWTNTAM